MQNVEAQQEPCVPALLHGAYSHTTCVQAVADGSDSDTGQPITGQTAHVTRPAVSSNLHLSHGLDAFKAPPLVELTDDRLAESLESAFGYGAFRGQQLEVVRRVLDGKSTLAVLPTGEQATQGGSTFTPNFPQVLFAQHCCPQMRQFCCC